MTAQLIDMAADDQLAETVGDAALAALLRTKPGDEVIPAAVWWLIAETLRTSVTIRRVVSGQEVASQPELSTLVGEATLLTEAALAELAETTGARPTPIALIPSRRDASRAAPTRPAFGLQLSVLFLARLLVSHRVTTPQRLANTLGAHLRALAILEA
jgi:hypothetical protein